MAIMMNKHHRDAIFALPDIWYIHFWLEENRSNHGINTMQHIWPHG
jgi:hypothetical protein